MYQTQVLKCAAATNTFYLTVPVKARILGASWTSDADPGGNKTVVVKPAGGNNIVTGNISATPGTIVKGTVTATLADAIAPVSPTLAIAVVLTTSNVCNVSLTLDLDEFVKTTAT